MVSLYRIIYKWVCISVMFCLAYCRSALRTYIKGHAAVILSVKLSKIT